MPNLKRKGIFLWIAAITKSQFTNSQLINKPPDNQS